jgi:hypothetical protein
MDGIFCDYWNVLPGSLLHCRTGLFFLPLFSCGEDRESGEFCLPGSLSLVELQDFNGRQSGTTTKFRSFVFELLMLQASLFLVDAEEEKKTTCLLLPLTEYTICH